MFYVTVQPSASLLRDAHKMLRILARDSLAKSRIHAMQPCEAWFYFCGTVRVSCYDFSSLTASQSQCKSLPVFGNWFPCHVSQVRVLLHFYSIQPFFSHLHIKDAVLLYHSKTAVHFILSLVRLVCKFLHRLHSAHLLNGA